MRLALAGKTLLKNHPHDDICGCSVDAVHEQMMTRFAEVTQIGAALTRISGRVLAGSIAPGAQGEMPLMLFNPLNWSRSEMLQCTLDLAPDDPCAQGFSIVDEFGETVRLQILAEERLLRTEVTLARWQHKHAVTLALRANAVPGVGYRAYYLRPQSVSPTQEPASGVWITEQGMENAFLGVTFHTNGSFDLEDKLRAQHYRKLHTFEDSEDAGSAYFSRPAPNSTVVSSQEIIARIELLTSGPVLAQYRIALALLLPTGLTADRQRRNSELRAVSIVSVVTLAAGERFVRVHTTVENVVEDHRLRVCFPTGVDSSCVAAGGHYAVHERPVDSAEYNDWVEQPSAAAPARLFVDANDGIRGLAVLFPDLSEYVTHRDAGQVVLSLTLLRCVGWLSRSDEGPIVPTPGGQCQGIHAFDYALLPHAPEERQASRFHERHGPHRRGNNPLHLTPIALSNHS